MKTFLWHVEWITARTHHPSEKFGLPLHTAKSCQFSRDDMVVQDIVELGRCITVYTSVYLNIAVHQSIY